MNLTRLSVRRPIGVTMIVVALLLLGLQSLDKIGLDLLPHVDFPTAAVVTVYPGADPQTIEQTITDPLERALSTVAGLKRMRSVSMESASLIIVEFGWGSNLERSLQNVKSTIETVGATLPEQAISPLLIRADVAQASLLTVAVLGGDNIVDVTRAINERVTPTLQRVEGVAAVEVVGGASEEITVRYDSNALAEFGINPMLLYQVLAYQNTMVPAGAIQDGDTRFHVRAGRQISSIEDLSRQPVAMRPLTNSTPGLGILALTQALPVRLSDVSEVVRQQAPQSSIARADDEPAVLLRILKQSDENTVTVASRVRDALAALNNDPSLDLDFLVVTDQSDLIRNSLANVAQSALWGALLAVVVLALFLRNFGSLAVISVAIPLSAIAAVGILHSAGTTLNLLSLGGLALAVGMLVDNAIVVLENIIRHREMGKPSIEAAADGGSEIAGAIVAATLSTLAVFIPIMTVQSLIGLLVRDMAIAVSASIFASMVIALTVVPAAASRWARTARKNPRSLASAAGPTERDQSPQDPTALDGLLEAAAGREDNKDQRGNNQRIFQRLYQSLLERWLKRPWPTIGVSAFLLATLIILPGQLNTVFLPPMDGGLINAYLTLPSGTTAETAESIVKYYNDSMEQIPEIEHVSVSVTYDHANATEFNFWQLTQSNQAHFMIVLEPHEKRQRTAQQISEVISTIPPVATERLKIEADRTAAALGDDYFPGLTLHVTGPDLDTLHELAANIEEKLSTTEGLQNVSSSLGQPQPELVYRIDDRSFQSVFTGGEPLTAGQVGLALRQHITGMVATHLTIDGTRLPVVLRPDPEEVTGIDSLNQYRIPGAQVNIGSSTSRPILERISSVEYADGPQSIEHLNRSRLVVITAELGDLTLEEARNVAREILQGMEIPTGYDIQIAGIHQVIDESAKELIGIVLLAIAFVYIVMAVLFESWTQPLLLMLCVPMAVIGSFLVLKILGHPLSVPAAIGLILIIGISVNNGIVMIDYINQLKRRGLSTKQAIIEGATARLRPILMTSLTTLFAVIPLAFSQGDGSEFQIPMAIVVTGGLLVSTLLSLFLLPGFLSLSGRRNVSP